MVLKSFAALTAPAVPVSETDMRNELEASQLAGFITDAGWAQLVGILVALQVDESSLTAAERSVINVLRTVVAPPAFLACCTTSGATPANSDGLTSLVGYARTGSFTFEHEIEMQLSGTYTCDIVSVDVDITPTGGAPAITSTNPFNVTPKSCTVAGDSLYNYLWATFASNPAGGSYDVIYTYLDADGATVATYPANYTLNL